MKKSTYFKYLMKVLITPRCWIRMFPSSEALDAKLLDLLKKHKFKKIDDYEAKLGNLTFWIKNHPHASFCSRKSFKRSLPKRTTALYAYERLIADTSRDKHV